MLVGSSTRSVSDWASGASVQPYTAVTPHGHVCRAAILCIPSEPPLSFPSPEGRACAVVFDCKFIETSAAVQHNVKELFEGIVRQVRLRRDSKEKNERRLAYQKRRESIPRKARRFWGKIVAKNNKNMAFKLKSKSCHDLSVL